MKNTMDLCLLYTPDIKNCQNDKYNDKSWHENDKTKTNKKPSQIDTSRSMELVKCQLQGST